MYSVEITKEAGEGIAKICRDRGKKVCEQMHTALKSLEDRPDLKGKPLGGDLKNYRSVRCGRFRIVYQVKGETATVFVVGVGKREDQAKADVYVQVKKFLGLRKS